ncbi:unnamed protein product [Adineta ricciae]|uniref:Uncharacterized protein n=1 Tax=Adineta ricciae TaxID=249248 RepID=A0A815CZJ0_ADIRI|nr:unnamed protein product [Adineta ricciae]
MMKLFFILCFLVVTLIADESGNMINARDGDGLLTPSETDLNTSDLEEQKDDSLVVSTESTQNTDGQASVENGGSVNNDTNKEGPKNDDDGNEESKNNDDRKDEPKHDKDSSEEEPKNDDSDERPKDEDRTREPKNNGEDCREKSSDDSDQKGDILEIQQIEEVADLLETEDNDENSAEEQTD